MSRFELGERVVKVRKGFGTLVKFNRAQRGTVVSCQCHDHCDLCDSPFFMSDDPRLGWYLIQWDGFDRVSGHYNDELRRLPVLDQFEEVLE